MATIIPDVTTIDAGKQISEIRIGIMGNVDSGKSTLTGVLTKQVLDDGNGKARSLVMKHKHELVTGRTSCVTHHYTRDIDLEANTERDVTYIDLAGHEKYLKTTINGIHRCYIDYSIVVIGANMGMESSTYTVQSKTAGFKTRRDTMKKQVNMTEEHLSLSLSLAIPTIIVITKVDICPDAVKDNTLSQITKFMDRKTLKSRKPITIKTMSDLDTFMSNYYNATPRNMTTPVPIIEVSSVTGAGLDILREFIARIPQHIDYNHAKHKPAHFVIDSTYHIKGIGLVVSGIMRSGMIHKGDVLHIGPIMRNFHAVTIKSIHNNFRELVSHIEAGQSGCFAIKSTNPTKMDIQRHMIRHGTHIMEKPEVFNEFRARIKILHHPTTIRLNYEPTVHCGAVTQSAQIIHMDRDYIRLGDIADVTFRFKFRPEFIQPEARLVFREGMTRGIGKIIEVVPYTI